MMLCLSEYRRFGSETRILAGNVEPDRQSARSGRRVTMTFHKRGTCAA
jgi:hypothetical protein